MRRGKLYALLVRFDKKELRLFHRFVRSPYYNQNEKFVVFLEIILKAMENKNQEAMMRENIMLQMFPDKKFDIKLFKYLSNQLLKLGEHFLAIRFFEQEGHTPSFYSMDAFVEKGLSKHYNYALGQIQGALTKEVARNESYHYNMYRLKSIEAKHFDRQKIRKTNTLLQEKIDTLDLYYFSSKLRLTCQVLNNQGFLAGTYKPRLSEGLIQLLKEEDFSEIPSIDYYLKLYDLLTEGKEQYFETMQKTLFKRPFMFPREEMKELYFIIINYCIRQLRKNTNNQFYLSRLFEIYKEGIDSEVLLENGFISPWTYKNIVKVGLRLRDFEGTKSFIIDYQNQLEEKFREDAFHYNMAELFYFKGELENALDHLIKVQYSDVYYVLGAKSLLIKVYYETDEFDPLDSLLASFGTYLRRNRMVTETVREPISNFIKCLKKIIRGRNNQDELVTYINEIGALADKKWLLQKISELK